MKEFYKYVEENNYEKAFEVFDNFINSGVNNKSKFLEGFKHSSLMIQNKIVNVVKGFIELQKLNYQKGFFDSRNEMEIEKCLDYNFTDIPKLCTVDQKDAEIYMKYGNGLIVGNLLIELEQYKNSDIAFVSELVYALINNHRTLNAYTTIWFISLIEENRKLFY